MYKKYLTLALNQQHKVSCQLPLVKDKCQIEVKILLERKITRFIRIRRRD